MKIIFVGDAVAKTGFSRCTHAVCDHLTAIGHQVMVLGLNYYGDPHQYRYQIFPCRQPFDGGHDQFGVGRLPVLVDRYKPDLVVLLNDPWNIPAYMESMAATAHKPKIAAWLAVDGCNQKGEQLTGLDLAMVWTDFAHDELIEGGCTVPIEIVPLGVDTDVFYPTDQTAARMAMLPPGLADADPFIIGVVGRNQIRKRLDLTIKYFAGWQARYRHDNVYLYIHTAPTGETGADLNSLVDYHGVRGRVLFTTGLTVGTGATNAFLRDMYNMFDMYFTTSQGEGWGLPALEAMACGVPCVLPRWAAYESWAQGVATLVSCTNTALTAPFNGGAYTIGGIMDQGLAIEALEHMYHNRRNHDTTTGIELARRLSWDNTCKRFVDAIATIDGLPATTDH